MDDLHSFAPSLESGPFAQSLTAQPPRLRAGDQALIATLINALADLIHADSVVSLSTRNVVIPEHSTLGQWNETYCKAVNQPAFLDWANRLKLDVATMTLRDGSLNVGLADAPATPRTTFRLADRSGWWKGSRPPWRWIPATLGCLTWANALDKPLANYPSS